MKARRNENDGPVVRELQKPASPKTPHGSSGEAGGAGEAGLLGFANVPLHGVDWLWSDWLPRGKTTLLAGAGGSGKGTFAGHVAACTTGGRPWPDDTRTEPAYAVIVSPDDALADTLKPRLLHSGADLDRCLRLCAGDIQGGIERIANTLLRSDVDIALVVVDMVEAGMRHGMDGNAAGDVARHLSAFNRLAERLDAAVLVCHHLNKWVRVKVLEGTLSNLVRGSGAWTDAVRMLWLMTADENDEDGSRILIRAKCNLGGVPWLKGGYRITARDASYDGENGRPGKTTVVKKVTQIGGSAHAIFAAAVTPAESAAPVKAGRQGAARDAIVEFLKPGVPVLKTHVIGVLTGRGHAQRTLERAADELEHGRKLIGRKKHRDEFSEANNNAVVWELPALPAPPAFPCAEIGEAEGDSDI